MNLSDYSPRSADIDQIMQQIDKHCGPLLLPKSVKHCLFFIGFPRSGNSFLGQLINAHRQALVANEGRVFALLEQYPDRDLLFRYLLTLDTRFGNRNYRKLARLGGDKHQHVDQNLFFEKGHQGKNDDLTLVGNSKAAGLTHYLFEHQDFLRNFASDYSLEFKLILMVRNPVSMIRSHHKRTGASLEEALHYYQVTAGKLQYLLDSGCVPCEPYFVYYEEFMANLEQASASLMSYLDLPCGQTEIEIFKSNQKLDAPLDAAIVIDDSLLQKIDDLIQQHGFFDAYRNSL